MNSLRATLAIARSRISTLWPMFALFVLTGAVFGWLQQNSLSPFAHETHVLLDEPGVWLVVPLAFTTLLAIAIAYTTTARSDKDAFAFCEEAAPLFGRERARAGALVPMLLIVACSIAEYAGARLNPNYGTPPTFFVFNAVAALTAMTVALSIPLRTAWNRILYVALAFGASAICGAIVIAAVSFTNDEILVLMGSNYFAEFNDAWGALAELVFALLIGFIALRQYGEALARFDPLPPSI